ncbi:hypothetical protein IU449_25130 [Nocardia higoensis]|uniref:Uncharacterized protein n=1 Tax=Nocardia higoensis TaxID=228599 RepID=A0ABS0DH42_9NOCA|nr:hypothetical protein [Nocardia higoensis]MBF6357786.1 hypothetical protein [Nocardia higoensis]
MTDTTTARSRLAGELGGDLAALDTLSQEQCADLLLLLEQAPDRDIECCEPQLRDNIDTLPRLCRPAVRRVFLGRWR